MYFIYFEYMKIQATQNRTTGMKETKSENSENVSFNKAGLFSKYNKAIRTYFSIQWFICDKEVDYPEFKGQSKELMSWL